MIKHIILYLIITTLLILVGCQIARDITDGLKRQPVGNESARQAVVSAAVQVAEKLSQNQNPDKDALLSLSRAIEAYFQTPTPNPLWSLDFILVVLGLATITVMGLAKLQLIDCGHHKWRRHR